MRRMITVAGLALMAAGAPQWMKPDSSAPAARTIVVHARRFSFDPAEIVVRAGEKVHLELISDDVTHSLLVKDLQIDETAKKGHPGETDFEATHAGDFQGQCGHFCGSGHGRMVFTVRVTGG